MVSSSFKCKKFTIVYALAWEKVGDALKKYRVYDSSVEDFCNKTVFKKFYDPAE